MDKGQARKIKIVEKLKMGKIKPIERYLEQEKYKTGRFYRTDVNKRKINEEKTFKNRENGFLYWVFGFENQNKPDILLKQA